MIDNVGNPITPFVVVAVWFSAGIGCASGTALHNSVVQHLASLLLSGQLILHSFWVEVAEVIVTHVVQFAVVTVLSIVAGQGLHTWQRIDASP